MENLQVTQKQTLNGNKNIVDNDEVMSMMRRLENETGFSFFYNNNKKKLRKSQYKQDQKVLKIIEDLEENFYFYDIDNRFNEINKCMKPVHIRGKELFNLTIPGYSNFIIYDNNLIDEIDLQEDPRLEEFNKHLINGIGASCFGAYRDLIRTERDEKNFDYYVDKLYRMKDEYENCKPIQRKKFRDILTPSKIYDMRYILNEFKIYDDRYKHHYALIAMYYKLMNLIRKYDIKSYNALTYKLIDEVNDGLEIRNERFEYNTSLKELFKYFIENPLQQSDSKITSWASNKIQQLVQDKVLETLTKTWPGIMLTGSVITGIVSSLLSVIFHSIDIYQRGTSPCGTLSYVCSLISLVAQISSAVSTTLIISDLDCFSDIIASSLSGLDSTSTIGEFLDQIKNIPQHQMVQKVSNMIGLVNPLAQFKEELVNCNENINFVDSNINYDCLINLSRSKFNRKEFKNDLVNFIGINNLTDYKDLSIELLKSVNANLIDNKHLKDLIRLFAIRYSFSICVHENNKDTFKILPTQSTDHVHLTILNSNFSCEPITYTQSNMPTIETFISIGCGFAALALSLSAMGGKSWASNISKELIQGTKLKDTILKNVADSREIMETLAEDCFNIKLGSHSLLKDDVIKCVDTLSSYLQHSHSYYASHPTEYFKFRDAIEKAQNLYCGFNIKSNNLSNSVINAMSLLNSDIQRAKSMFIELGKAAQSGRSRQETVPIQIYGRKGAGKTYFTNQYLIPEIAKYFGFDQSIYALNFGGQVYFIPYSGQEICLYDEFLATGVNDPIIQHMNGICSGGFYNMPGADLWTKYQECLIKLMLLISNSPYVNLKNCLTADAEGAFYSRLIRYEIVNRDVPDHDDYTRDSIQHTEDFSEFEIRKYLRPATVKSPSCAKSVTRPGVDTTQETDPYVIITKEQMLQEIIYRMETAQAKFNKLVPPPMPSEIATQCRGISLPRKLNPGVAPFVPSRSHEITNSKLSQIENTIPQDLTEPNDYMKELNNLIIFSEHIGNNEIMDKRLDNLAIMNDFKKFTEQQNEEAYNGWETLCNLLKKNSYISDQRYLELERLIFTPEQQSTDSKVDHYVLLMYGSTDTGKSVAATEMGITLSKYFKLPFINVTQQNFKELTINVPSVVVLHDKMYNEQQYIEFYDSLPKPSIIINTCNIKIFNKTGYYPDESATHKWNSSNSYFKNLWESICINSVNFKLNFRTVSVIDNGNRNSECGFARRLGVSGYIYHAKMVHYRTPESCDNYEVMKYGKFVYNNDEYSKAQVIDNIIIKYSNLCHSNSEIKIEYVDHLNLTKADVELKFESFQQMEETVNSSIESVKMFTRFMNEDKSLPSISLSEGIFKTSFVLTPQMFSINKELTCETAKEMMIRSYLCLLKGNSKFTCSLEINNQFRIMCQNRKVNVCVMNKESQFSMLTHELNEYIDNDIKKINIRIFKTKNNSKELISVLDGEEVAKVITFGIQEASSLNQLESLKYICDVSSLFENEPTMFPYFLKYRARIINVQDKVDNYETFANLWYNFTQSKWYIVVKILLALIATVLSILSIISVGKIIFSVFKTETKEINDKDKITSLFYQGEIIKLKTSLKGNTVTSTISISNGKDLDTLNSVIIEAIEELYGQNVNIGQVQFNFTQSEKTEGKRLGKKSKNIGHKLQRKIDLTTGSEQAFISQTSIDIQQKVYENGCWVQGSKSSCYGLRWKNLDILTPSHIWKANNDRGMVNVHNNGAISTYEVMAYWVDHNNDIAVCRILDKTANQSKDITKYFCRESTVERYNEALVLLRQIDESKRPYAFHEAPKMCFVGHLGVIRQNGKEIGVSSRRQFTFYRTKCLEIATRSGDCGSVYVISDKNAGHEMIVGLHTNIYPSARQSLGSLISQEYLESVTNYKIDTIQQGVDLISEMSVWDANSNFKNLIPHQQDFGVDYGMSDFYAEWYESLEEVEQVPDIFYDAEENPTANIKFLGYDRKFMPSWIGKPSHNETPWSEYIEQDMPSKKWLSVTDYKKLPQEIVETLPVLKGIPSVLANQVRMYNDPCIQSAEVSELLEGAYLDELSECRVNYVGSYRILNDLEVINGTKFVKDDIYGGLEAMDLTASCGDYPNRRYGLTTKEKLFRKTNMLDFSGGDVYDWDDTYMGYDVMRKCLQHEFLACSGIREIIPNKDVLKREIVEKHNKSRLFTVLSIEQVFVGRKYTGALQAIVMKNRHLAHCQVGIYPQPGFNELYQRFLKISKYGEAADFSRWDKHLMAGLIKKSCDLMCQLYLDNNSKEIHESIINVWKVMCDEIVNSVSVCDGFVYMKIRGNPSGCPITTMLNGFVNDIQTFMCIRWLVKEHNNFIDTNPTDEDLVNKYGREFNDKIRIMREKIVYSLEWVQAHFDWINYGDDILKVIHVDYLWLVNFMSSKMFYETVLGISYDTAKKDGSTYLFDKLEGLDFISRKFRLDGGLIFSALKKSSIESLLHWSRNNNIEQWKDNIKICLDEAVLWGEEYYNYIISIIIKILKYCRQYRIPLELSLPSYKDRNEWAISIIINGGVSPSSTPKVDYHNNISKMETKINSILNSGFKPTKTASLDSNLGCARLTANKKFEQATGTQERNPMQGGENQSPDGEMVFAMNGPNVVPKSDIKRVLWHKNIYEVATTPMETPDSPISVNIDTPAHSVIWKRSLNDMTHMPPGMKMWASIHKYSNATRVISVKFISAATLINELVLGISPVNKSTYTIQELQLVHWVAINPQDVVATIELKLADVAWDGFSNGEVNRYQFVNGYDDLTSGEVNIPTVVLLTRVGIQNSFDNTKLSVQLAITEHFKKDGCFLIDQNILNSGLPKTIDGYRQQNGTTLSDWLNIDAGRPFNIACDGGFVVPQTTNIVKNVKKFEIQSQTSYYYRDVKDGDTRMNVTVQEIPSFTYPIFPKILNPDVYSENILGSIGLQYSDDRDLIMLDNTLHGGKMLRNIMNWGAMMTVNCLNNVKLKANDVKHINIEFVFQYMKQDDVLEWMITLFNFFYDFEQIKVSQLPKGVVDYKNLVYKIEPFKDHHNSVEVVCTPTTDTLNSALEDWPEYLVEIVGRDNETAVCYVNFIKQFREEEKVYNHINNNVTSVMKFDEFGVRYPDIVYVADVKQVAVIDNLSIAQTASNLIYLHRNEISSLDSFFTRLSFPLALPTTLTPIEAETHSAIEFDDSVFVNAFLNKLRAVKIDSNRNDILILFNLSTKVNGGISIVVAFNPEYQVFFISNSPQRNEDYYKVFRKLRYEDVVISQVRVIDKLTGLVPFTNTSNWINRVSDSKTYDGRTLVTSSMLSKFSKTNKFKFNSKLQQSAAAMGVMAGGQIIASLFQQIGGYLMQKGLMDKELEIYLQQLQAQTSAQMKLLDKQFDLKLRNAQSIANQQFNNDMTRNGLISALPSAMNGDGRTGIAPPKAMNEDASTGKPSWMSETDAKKPMYSQFIKGGTEFQNVNGDIQASPTTLGNSNLESAKSPETEVPKEGLNNTLRSRGPYIQNGAYNEAILNSLVTQYPDEPKLDAALKSYNHEIDNPNMTTQYYHNKDDLADFYSAMDRNPDDDRIKLSEYGNKNGKTLADRWNIPNVSMKDIDDENGKLKDYENNRQNFKFQEHMRDVMSNHSYQQHMKDVMSDYFKFHKNPKISNFINFNRYL